jgi:3-hydroxybutyryl-CoA dehydrogenase
MLLSEVSEIQVVGAGQMGQGIAQVTAAAGFSVTLCDQTLELAEAGQARIKKNIGRLVEKQKLGPAEADAILLRLTPHALATAPTTAQLAIEAVSESFELKRAVFQQLDARLPRTSLLFSNTSSISITKLAATTTRPTQVLGLHFMNPVPLMQLVEVIRGLETSGATLELATALTARLGKTVVVSADRPGFIVNRILIPLLNEACFALQEGVANTADIDAAVHLGLNHPLGPLALADLIGLDTVLAIAEVLHREIGDDKYRPASLLRNLVAAGHLGRKTQRGFYNYTTDPVTPALLQ